MKKKLFLALAAAAVVLIAAPAAHAQTSVIFENGLLETGDLEAEGGAFQRYYQVDGTGNGNINGAGAPATCAQPDGSCKAAFRAMANDYRGYADDTLNYGITSDGNLFGSIWDVETGSGTSNHRGYYAWAEKRVNTANTSQWNDAACGGANLQDCIGPLGPSDVGPSQTDVPNGPIDNIGGATPIPVPRVTNVDTALGDISLAWDAAVPYSGETAGANYDLLVNTQPVAGNSCGTPPTEAEFNEVGGFQGIAGTSTTVNATDFGQTPGDEVCATFALRLVLPRTTAGPPVKSLFISANGQAAYLGAGGLASTVFGVQASTVGNRAVRGEQPVQITFQTSIEATGDVFTVVTGDSATGSFVPVEGCSFESQFGETGGVYDTCLTTVPRGECPYFSVESDTAGLIQPAVQLEGCKERPGNGRGRDR